MEVEREMTKTLGRRILGVMAVATLGATLGQASTIYVPAQSVNFGAIAPSGSTTLFFNKFDQSAYSSPTMLAVLTSVEIDAATTSNGQVQVVYFGAPGTYAGFSNAYTQVPLAINASGVVNYNVLAKVTNCGAFTTPQPPSGGCTNTGSPSTGVNGDAYGFGTPGLDTAGSTPNVWNTVSNVTGTASGQAFVNPTMYSNYQAPNGGIGGVSVTINAGSASSAGTGAAGAMGFGGSASTSGTISIIYGYDLVSVPEPVTMGLTGSALMGLCLVIRRKRNRA
jgi:hypothetical protein